MIERFEDLPVWQDARKLTKEIYMVTTNEKFNKDFRLKGQIQASSVSTMSNIAEGFENQSKQQFIRYLYIARGSCGELRSQLYVAYDVEYMNENVMDKLKNDSTSILKQCTGLIKYLERYQSSTDRVQESNENDFLKIITNYYSEN